MTQVCDSDTNFGIEDCGYALRALETEAYSAVISALRAQGSLSQYCHLILEHLRLILNVTFERHKAEVRRALADPILLKVASGLNPQNDVTFEWAEEAKRAGASGNLASSLVLCSPSFYRFGFLRSSKNDSLLQLADQLAYLAVEHNRSKSVENGEAKFFEALKKQKILPPDAASTTKTPEFSPPFDKIDTVAPTASFEPAKVATAPRAKQTVSTAKSKLAQKDTGVAAASTGTNGSLKQQAIGKVRKGAGRPRKVPTDVPIAKQRFGQLIAARSASAMRRQVVGSLKQERGKGRKKLVTTTASTLRSPLAQRLPSSIPGGQQSQVQQLSTPFIPHYHQHATPPRTPPRPVPMSQLGSPAARSMISDQPAIGQKSPHGKQITKRPAVSAEFNAWKHVDSKPQSKFGCSAGIRVPVAPLSLMLPVSTSSAAKGSGTSSRFCSGPSSPTRPSLTGEAPGVYADDYNANSLESSDLATTAQSPDIPMQPHHFFSSLSATYYSQNTPPSVKMRRVSPAANVTSQNVVMTSVPTLPSRVTGITVKPKSSGGAVTSEADGGHKLTAGSGNLQSGSFSMPLHRLDQAQGQKVIVLPSSIIRRAQQQQTSQQPGTPSPVSDQFAKCQQKMSSIYEYFELKENDPLHAVCKSCQTQLSRGGPTLGQCTTTSMRDISNADSLQNKMSDPSQRQAAKQQSVIIVRRAPSTPLGSFAVSGATTTVASAPSASVERTTPPESQTEAKNE